MKTDSNRINHDLFDTWNENSAYILGFWYADGWICFKKNKSRIDKTWGLASVDREFLCYFSKFLGKEVCLSHAATVRCKACWQILIYSAKLFDFCFKYAQTTRKSETRLKLPFDIPSHLTHHFIRGFFDGDGSIHWVNYKTRHGKRVSNLRLSFSAGNATGNLLDEVAATINKHLGIYKKFKHNPNAVSQKLRYGQFDTAMICSWLYKDATMFLDRKKAIWDAADKDKLKNSLKYRRLIPAS